MALKVDLGAHVAITGKVHTIQDQALIAVIGAYQAEVILQEEGVDIFEALSLLRQT